MESGNDIMNLKTLFLELFLLLDIKLLYVVFNPINSPLVAPIPCKNKETAGGAKMLHTIGGNRVKNLPITHLHDKYVEKTICICDTQAN